MARPSVNEILSRKFAATGHDKFSEFIRDVKSELPLETWTKVLKRGGNPDLRTLLKMAADLNFTHDEARELLISFGEKQISKWITSTSFTLEEQSLVDKFRRIKDDPVKSKLVKDLIDNLAR